MGKRIIACLLTAILLCSGGSALAAAPTLNSGAACLMDAATGEVLYEKDAYKQMPMASITKVMTALLVIEKGDLNASTVATAEAINSVDLQSTRVGFVPDEQLTVDELMYCMLVDSANDAANILAAYVAGDVASFVEMMNQRAAELGCTNTHFANPNGLDTDGHYTCAHDMAIITRAANQHPEFAKYSSAVSYQLPADNVIGEGWQVWTKVNMIKQDDPTYDARVYAAKTGWTTNAHNTFVACGKSDCGDFIVTVLNCPVKNGIFLDTTALFNYAEQGYSSVTVPAADYAKAAKKAAKKAGYKIDPDALEDITLRLPKGMDASALTYTCEATGDGAQLAVMIADDSRAAYTAATGLDGSQPLRRVTLPVQNAAQEPEDTGSAALVTQDGGTAEGITDRIPDAAWNIIMVVAVVIGAVVLMLVLLFLLGLYRRIRGRKHKNKTK
ncbi:MAG: serine hydrolase [Eubacteriales bacterium]|nr:serine hydrolase [Eubacteriales bacterium]